MGIAIVGCGYVADHYLKALPLHPELKLLGVIDRDRNRSSRFSAHHSVAAYTSFEALLEDDRVDIVVNLTNPHSHFTVSRACLEAGKSVYSEKPLAMRLPEARELVELAESKGLQISSAPCTFLNESAQTMWKALRENRIGTVRLAYAEMDDGLVHRAPYREWVSDSGASWPYKDEFEVGCTIEHAGYAVTWLSGVFGPAETVTAFSSCLISDKETDVPLEVLTPDFSVAAITFRCGVVARLTCSIVAPRDHSLKIFGDEGELCVDDLWNDRSRVYIRRMIRIRRRTFPTPWKKRYRLIGEPKMKVRSGGAQQVDFCHGIAEMAAAIRAGRSPRLSPRYCLHNTELVLAIQAAREKGSTYEVSSSFEPIEPMPYARA